MLDKGLCSNNSSFWRTFNTSPFYPCVLLRGKGVCPTSPGLCMHTHLSTSTLFGVWPHHCSHKASVCQPTHGLLPKSPLQPHGATHYSVHHGSLPSSSQGPTFISLDSTWHNCVIIVWEGGFCPGHLGAWKAGNVFSCSNLQQLALQ